MSAHILLFDSGIGGTSVLQHIQSLLPSAQYSYVMDNAYLPYGEQSQATIISRLLALLNFIKQRQLQVDVIVIACNTATTLAIDILRQHTQIPIVGVVPAIKPACLQSKTQKVALLATPLTVTNQYTAQLIKDFATNVEVKLYGSSRLVTLAESVFYTKAPCNEEVAQELDSLAIDDDIDVLVLGCTHFPILADAINSFFQGRVTLLDSGKAIAKRVLSVLDCSEPNKTTAIKKPLHWYVTADIKSTEFTAERITLIDPTLGESC